MDIETETEPDREINQIRENQIEVEPNWSHPKLKFDQKLWTKLNVPSEFTRGSYLPLRVIPNKNSEQKSRNQNTNKTS